MLDRFGLCWAAPVAHRGQGQLRDTAVAQKIGGIRLRALKSSALVICHSSGIQYTIKTSHTGQEVDLLEIFNKPTDVFCLIFLNFNPPSEKSSNRDRTFHFSKYFHL